MKKDEGGLVVLPHACAAAMLDAPMRPRRTILFCHAKKHTAGASVDAGPAKAVVREGSGGANLTSRKGPMGDLPMGAEREDAAERMRRIEVPCAVRCLVLWV